MIGMKQSDACSHWGLGLVSVRWRWDRIRREVEWGLGRGEGEKARGGIWREGWAKKARQMGGYACEGPGGA